MEAVQLPLGGGVGAAGSGLPRHDEEEARRGVDDVRVGSSVNNHDDDAMDMEPGGSTDGRPGRSRWAEVRVQVCMPTDSSR